MFSWWNRRLLRLYQPVLDELDRRIEKGGNVTISVEVLMEFEDADEFLSALTHSHYQFKRKDEISRIGSKVILVDLFREKEESPCHRVVFLEGTCYRKNNYFQKQIDRDRDRNEDEDEEDSD